MARSRIAFLLSFTLALAAISSVAHAQVMPSSSGGGIVTGTPQPAGGPAAPTFTLRSAGLDLSAIRVWLGLSLGRAIRATPATPLRSQHAIRERNTHGAL